ncbi:hypothetical protein [Collimonas fungivorans]|uniref:hypothetical protein n=1 Tax=Collimonas fungivorans TaxID=158899 RepID=UPI0026EDE471|nr:hypothetical protein [Collimonas fungivorans]
MNSGLLDEWRRAGHLFLIDRLAATISDAQELRYQGILIFARDPRSVLSEIPYASREGEQPLRWMRLAIVSTEIFFENVALDDVIFLKEILTRNSGLPDWNFLLHCSSWVPTLIAGYRMMEQPT